MYDKEILKLLHKMKYSAHHLDANKALGSWHMDYIN